MATKIFVNLPVKNLSETKAFFAKLGFSYDPQFTDENAACMVISEDIYAMLLVEDFYATFTNGKAIADAARTSEAIIAITADSKQAVDDMLRKAREAGAAPYKKAERQGPMYGGGFQDLDGHLWEVFFMDPAAVQGAKA